MSLRTRTARKFDPSKLEPQYMKFFMELSTMISRAQQQPNATATQFDSSDFLVRRLEEYEGTFIVLTTRIEESYAQEPNLNTSSAIYTSYFASLTSYDVTSRELQKNPRGIWSGLRSRLLSLLK